MRKGILSSLSINYTDNKTAYYIRDVTQRISSAFSVFKTKSRLMDILYYTTNTTQQLDFIPYIPNSVYSGITMTVMTNVNFSLTPNTLITFVGYRLPVNTYLPLPQYNETITINTPLGNIIASATYTDSGTTFISTVAFQKYLVLNGDGKFINASHIIIYFDNEGQIFGPPKSRKIEVYENYL